MSTLGPITEDEVMTGKGYKQLSISWQRYKKTDQERDDERFRRPRDRSQK